MKTHLSLLASLTLSCSPVSRASGPDTVMVRDQFSVATFHQDWVVVAPSVVGAVARVQDGAIALTLPAGNEDDIVLRRTFDVAAARGQRIRLSTRVRTDGSSRSSAHAAITVSTSAIAPSYRDRASTSSINLTAWTDLHTVIDVPAEATSAHVDLVLHGSGTAWFKDVAITALGASPAPAPIQLSSQDIDRLVTLTRAAALIRYLHPSDQVATLDWNTFLPGAIDHVLRAPPRADLIRELRAVFADIAPTVTFSRAAGSAGPMTSPPGAGAGDHLVRWRRYGLGTSAPFATYREGRDPDTTSASGSTRIHIDPKACHKASFRAVGHKLSGPGKAVLFVQWLQPGMKKQESHESLDDSGGASVLTTDVPPDTQDADVGIRVEGRSGATLERLTVSCDEGAPRAVDIAHGAWTYTGFTNLYAWQVTECDGAPCIQLQRALRDTSFDPQRDMLHGDIGNGIVAHIPLAVWADAVHTLPVITGSPELRDFTIDDAPVRLAAISAAWGTLAVFYPYFADQHIDWLESLPGALQEAAAARSPRDTHAAIYHLLAHLHDNHARVTHPGSPITGILPITFRRFGSKFVITGGVPEYLKTSPPGGEIEQIEGIATDRVYDWTAGQVSAATESFRDYLAPARMGMGYPGTFMRLRIKDRDGHVDDHVLPLVSDELYTHVNREPRPAQGTEMAPGIFYLDMDSLAKDDWERLFPTLLHAKALILDFRGYATSATLELFSHISDRPLRSPEWQTPLVPSVDGLKYVSAHWEMRPRGPRLAAKIVGLIDARAMSAVETLLQLIRENHLGILVGETSGGTNGNVAYALIPGGFELRFTAIRASGADGSTVHGRGFAPDDVVHPTLEGIRTGRDEILDAGVAAARRLASP